MVSRLAKPSKTLHKCSLTVACNKGKQHKTSYKAISADETYGILKDFITFIENQITNKVKAIRCDNGTEFKNSKLIELCRSKGIRRDYSNARTPTTKCGLLKEKIELLIRGMQERCFADSKSGLQCSQHRPIKTFWVSLTILNTSDHLENLREKLMKALLLGMLLLVRLIESNNLSSKKIEETLNLENILEENLMFTGFGSLWYPSPNLHTAGTKVNKASDMVESSSDYAEELARLQKQAYAANATAVKHLSPTDLSNQLLDILSWIEACKRRCNSWLIRKNEACPLYQWKMLLDKMDSEEQKRCQRGFMVYQMDGKSAFPVWELEMKLCPSIKHPRAWVYVDDIIFGSTNQAWCDEFKVLMKGEFEMSAMEKSTTGGGSILGRRLISWHAKPNHCGYLSSTKAEYVAVSVQLLRVAVVASGGVESRVRESDSGDRIDREMGRVFGVGRKSSPENFSGGCGGGRRLPDIWEGEERVMRECPRAKLEKLSGLSFHSEFALGFRA
ncbi:putative ribonuclease H-like domain-containing protein [Tanacetum coccineum]|uniref:Ribonuclease H-like domain-containing protein n=1 Tax=Tanacetum coccineum TaxID=301880 RepID=A0ABQ5BYU3_9ASTR